MWQEGQEEDEDLFDDVPENFVLCALHQAKIIRERWKFWSGSVPANVSVRLHRLESRLSINEQVCQRKSISAIIQSNIEPIKTSLNNSQRELAFNNSSIPLQQMSKMDSSQPFLAEIIDCPSIDQYLTERIEPKHNIIIQGPDIRHIVRQKRRVHFWCCH